MNSPQWKELLHTQLKDFRDDADDIAITVADHVWETVAVETGRFAEDGVMWDMADSLQMSLSSTVWLAFDEACERHVLARFEAIDAALARAGLPEKMLASAGTQLAALKKGIRLRQRVDPLLQEAFAKGQPGVLTKVFRAVTDTELENMDADMRADGQRIRDAVAKQRPEIVVAVQETIRELIGLGRMAYQEALTQTLKECDEQLCHSAA